MYCTYSSMAKGSGWAKATLKSKKIKPVVLSYTSLKALGSDLISCSVENSIKLSVLNSIAISIWRLNQLLSKKFLGDVILWATPTPSMSQLWSTIISSLAKFSSSEEPQNLSSSTQTYNGTKNLKFYNFVCALYTLLLSPIIYSVNDI